MSWAKVSFLFLLSFQILSAQEYFQQDVNYIIDARFNDQEHLLSADMKITYTNNSPNKLGEIYFHLYPNAFKNQESYFTADQIKRGENSFYFSKEFQRGGFNEIDFKIDGQSVVYSPYNGFEDVVILSLNEDLLSGESLEIEIDFVLKVPHFFSRLGRSKDRYHFMHWYPRPAVYDQEGWHPMHYGLVGEFFGEFGSYQVSLTIPKEYKLAFTGKGTSEGLNSSQDSTNTWAINAENVHDFAWVASKNFKVEAKNISSIDGRQIELQILSEPHKDEYWDEAMSLLEESFVFYENNVGPYPYEKLVLVKASKNGHGNMEYPGLILVEDRGNKLSLDYYINHELGHMWFYGALGFNERDEPWLDEGLTTFFEHRYTLAKRGKSHYSELANGAIKNGETMEAIDAFIISNIHCNCHQRGDTPSNEITRINYAIRNYEMAASYFLYLQEFLGKKLFDEGIKKFYERWKFKHPSTQDLQSFFEKESAKDLAWFFDELMITDRKIDYSIKGINEKEDGYSLQLENKGNLSIPVLISGLRDGKAVYHKWVDTFKESMQVEIDAKDLDELIIDEGNLIFDVNRSNNHIKTKGLFKKWEAPRLSRARTTDASKDSDLFLSLLMGFNTTDGFQLGSGILNTTIPTKNFSWVLNPHYAFESKSLVGNGRIGYNHFPEKGRFRYISSEIDYKTYHFSDFNLSFTTEEFNSRYHKIAPQITIGFNHKPIDHTDSWLSFRYIHLIEDSWSIATDSTGPVSATKENRNFGIKEIQFGKSKSDGLTKKDFDLTLEQQNYKDVFGESKNYLKLTGRYKTKWFYGQHRSVKLRVFASGFLMNSERESSNFNDALVRGSIPLFAQGFNDYLYDGSFFVRKDQDEKRFFRSQLGTHGGGFKHALGSSQKLGNSNNYLVAINLSSSLPIDLPIVFRPFKVFLDAAYFSTKSFQNDPLENQFLYSIGLTYDLDKFQIHLPLFYSDEIDLATQDRGILNRITFSIDLPRFDFRGLTNFIDLY